MVLILNIAYYHYCEDYIIATGWFMKKQTEAIKELAGRLLVINMEQISIYATMEQI